MNGASFRLYDVLDNAASAVAEATAGHQDRARAHLTAAKDAASAYAQDCAPETAHALGLLLAAASPGRYRTPGQSAALCEALAVHGTAALCALRASRLAAGGYLAEAERSAGPLRTLVPAFRVVRAAISIRQAPAGTEAS